MAESNQNELEICINKILAEALLDDKLAKANEDYIHVRGKEWECFDCDGYKEGCIHYKPNL